MKRGVIKICFSFILLCAISCQALPKNFEALVVEVKDGDTIKILYKKKGYIIRLEGIDCPEKKQAFGNKAKQLTSSLCFNKVVKVISNGKQDQYKRIVAKVYIGNRNLSEELIAQGLAWHYKKYSDDLVYSTLEKQAIKKKIGLWSDKKPVAPWEFRIKKLNRLSDVKPILK
jgi:micrococcal nuclease